MYKCLALSLVFLLFLAGCANAQQLNIIANKRSVYTIVLPENAGSAEIAAANLLQSYLQKITSVKLPVVKKGSQGIQNAIIISRQNKQNGNIVSTDLEEDGFGIVTRGSDLYFIGGKNRGLTYAVYTFLESYMGCRMYTPYNKIIPATDKLVLAANINDIQVPRLKHRQYWYFGSFVPNEEFLLWHKLDNYKTDKSWNGFLSHSYKNYMPASISLSNRPDFFALVDGKRNAGQLDYTNDALIQAVIAELKRQMKTNKDIVWPINAEDNEGFCTCEKCQVAYKKEGTKMGAVLYFVNKIAAAFPDKEFTTLAYLSTQKPPRTFKPGANVKIVLCAMNNVLNIPLSVSGNSKVNDTYVGILKEWQTKTNNLLIWEYEGLFRNIYVPFPVLGNMANNIRFYAQRGVSGMFIEGDGGLKASFSEVKAYLAAKLMWNPKLNENEIIAEYFNWYYGKGGQVMLDYYKTLNANFQQSTMALNCMSDISTDWAVHGYFTPAMVSNYRSILDKALSSSNGDNQAIQKINFQKMGLDYIDIELMKRKGEKNANVQLKLKNYYESLKTQDIKVSNYFLRPIETYKEETNNILSK